MQRTNISYLTHSWNPIDMICTPISEGCKNCWHLAMVKRFGNKSKTPKLIDKELIAPLRLRKPARIGVQFMGDLFHDDVPFGTLDQIMTTVALCQQHTFLMLTKRQDKMSRYFESLEKLKKGSVRDMRIWDAWRAVYGTKLNDRIYPLSNLWLGLTICTQQEWDEKLPVFLQIPGKKWLSIEPCLENLKFEISNLKLLDGVVVGCESGANRRPCNIEWIRSIVGQCRAVGVPVFVKQVNINGQISHNPSECPEDVRVQELPK